METFNENLKVLFRLSDKYSNINVLLNEKNTLCQTNYPIEKKKP